jgi:lipoprotein-releasing system ATP-binding protein
MQVAIHDLHKRYFLHNEPISVLQNVTNVIESGQLVSLTGPSGAGKSTLLHILGTLDGPSQGRVDYDGVDVWRLSPSAIARFRNTRIGYVFQFHHLLPEFSALENVMMPGRIARQDLSTLQARATQLLSEVGLGARADHRPGELSGGEQQRVALARALINEPQLLLADEPTGNLDEATGDGIHRIIEELHRTRKLTAVVVTHNPRLAARMPRRLHLDKTGLHEVEPSRAPATAAAVAG